MKEQLIEYLKPTFPKVFLALSFLGWQYFYSFQGFRLEFLGAYASYVTGGLSEINWNNYFVRNLSLLFVWILVAFIIFIVIWFFEKLTVSFYNYKIARQYANQPKENYENLLHEHLNLTEHIKSRSLWIAGILITLISFFALSDLFERLRFSALDNLMWKMIENGETIDIFNPAYTIVSFVAMSIFWYFIAAAIVFIFHEQKTKEKEEEISEEHFAVPIDTAGRKE